NICPYKSPEEMEVAKKNPNEEDKKLSLLFEETDPVDFQFKANKIQISFNAKYRKRRQSMDVPHKTLLHDPDPKKDAVETIPYRVDLTYHIEGTGLKPDPVRVVERESAVAVQEEAHTRTGLRPTALLGSFEKKLIESQFKSFEKPFEI